MEVNHGSETQSTITLCDVAQSVDAVHINEVLWPRESKSEQRHQALAAG
jgi:hypothetical protein